MVDRILQWVRVRQSGQSLAEYALILAFVAAVCIAALRLLGGTIATALIGVAGAF